MIFRRLSSEDHENLRKVDSKTGMLTHIGYQPMGPHPRQFNTTPKGRYLLCCSRDSDKIKMFRHNLQTGLLTDVHQDIPVSKAVCVQFVGQQ